MFMRHRMLLSCVASLLLLGSGRAIPSAVGGEIPSTKTASDLQALLQSKGYIAIPFRRFETGHLGIDVRLGEKRLSLIIDTGAPSTWFDRSRTKDVGIAWNTAKSEPTKGRPDGEFAYTSVENLTVGPIKTSRLYVSHFDLTEINQSLVQAGHSAADGLLGNDVLGPHQAIIDVPNRTLYLQPRATPMTVVANSNAAKPLANARCQVSFWNLSGRDLTLIVAGRTTTVAKNRVVRMELEREFTLHIEGRGQQVVRVPAAEPEHQVVIRN